MRGCGTRTWAECSRELERGSSEKVVGAAEGRRGRTDFRALQKNFTMESQNCLDWKSPLRLSPTVPPSLPRLLRTQVPKCHIHVAVRYPQGWGLHHCPMLRDQKPEESNITQKNKQPQLCTGRDQHTVSHPYWEQRAVPPWGVLGNSSAHGESTIRRHQEKICSFLHPVLPCGIRCCHPPQKGTGEVGRVSGQKARESGID